jgi:AraC family transcriptional regulator of arabinose operon
MDTTNDRRITWAVEYMQRHLGKPIAVGDLARRVNLSTSRFRHLFTAQTGLSPAQFLRVLRLRRARLLIERTSLSVKEVMTLVGYNDPSHFSKDFSTAYGVSPSVLRGRGVLTPRDLEVTRLPRRHRRPRAREPGRRESLIDNP